jgi:hypothetical protein
VNNNENRVVVESKQEWARPELLRIEAGSAESNFSGVNDNSNPQAS